MPVILWPRAGGSHDGVSLVDHLRRETLQEVMQPFTLPVPALAPASWIEAQWWLSLLAAQLRLENLPGHPARLIHLHVSKGLRLVM